jgi:hypothetical protein
MCAHKAAGLGRAGIRRATSSAGRCSLPALRVVFRPAGKGSPISSPGSPPVASPDGVRAPATDVVGSRRCPVCLRGPLTDRQEVCSSQCRAARSRQRRAATQRERDADIRALLEALKRLTEDDP